MPALISTGTYLSEPQSAIRMTSRGTFTQFDTYDVFPLAAMSAWALLTTIDANAPASGAPRAGTPTIPVVVGESYGRKAGIDYATRRTDTMSQPLAEGEAFCFFTGISGHYFNDSDSARVDRSDGRITLVTTTPVRKDRNPGATAQCVRFDSL